MPNLGHEESFSATHLHIVNALSAQHHHFLHQLVAGRSQHRQLLRHSREAISTSWQLLTRCSQTRSFDSNDQPRFLTKQTYEARLEAVSVAFDDREYHGTYGVSPSGHQNSFFVTVYSDHGEATGWVHGRPELAAEALLLKLALIAGRH